MHDWNLRIGSWCWETLQQETFLGTRYFSCVDVWSFVCMKTICCFVKIEKIRLNKPNQNSVVGAKWNFSVLALSSYNTHGSPLSYFCIWRLTHLFALTNTVVWMLTYILVGGSLHFTHVPSTKSPFIIFFNKVMFFCVSWLMSGLGKSLIAESRCRSTPANIIDFLLFFLKSEVHMCSITPYLKHFTLCRKTVKCCTNTIQSFYRYFIIKFSA